METFMIINFIHEKSLSISQKKSCYLLPYV